MKHLLFLFLFVCTIQLNGQTVKEWMGLPPVPVEFPAFGNVKNVENKTFSQADLLTLSTFNIENFTPSVGSRELQYHSLTWETANVTDDIVISKGGNDSPAIGLNAVYAANTQWISGKLQFSFYGNAEVYVDGVKVITYTSHKGTEAVNQECTVQWVPGKHTIIVKSLLTKDSDKLFSAQFIANPEFKDVPVEFTLSPKRGKNILDVLNGPRVGGLQVSPSGKYLIMTEGEIIKGKSSSMTNVYRITDKEIVYTFYGDNASNLTWIPGEDKLSYLLKEGTGNSLYTYDIEQKSLKRLFKADQAISSFTWSPDLVYYKNENYNAKEWELRKLDGIEDRQAYYRNRYFLCKYDMNTGIHTRLTWGNYTTSIMDISHNGDQILISTGYPDYNEYPYRKQSIYLLNARTNQVDTLWKDRLVGIQCAFSPDDAQLIISGAADAFGKIGVNIAKGQIVNGYDTQLYIYDLKSKNVTPITKDFNPSVSNYVWHKDGNIYIIAGDTDYIHLFRYGKDGKISKIKCPGDLVQRISLAQNGNIGVYTASDESYPTRVYTLNLTDLDAKEWANPQGEQYKNIVFGQVKDWDYNYKKGTTIDGRYYLPADFDPNKKYPMIVYYYGGTSPVERTFGGRWPFNLYAANGYVVYVMQPSGTTGFGQEFSARHQNNWGIITADEIIACTKAFLKAHPFVDAKRVGCMGASYGGFTTMYLQTRTDIFACAISHAGISSISSYWGEGYWGYSYSTNASAHSFPWNRKDIYVDQSPLFNADKVKTPMLLLHGTADVNVPTGESIQFYTALKLLGKDVELVLIKNADHAVVDYNQRIIWGNTIMAYFAKYLKGQPAWWENMYKDKNL